MNIRNTAPRAPILAACLALLILPATSVIALADAAIPRESVPYGDLDLATVGGQAALESRIRKAASRVCEDRGRRSSAAAHNSHRCREASFARGMIQADALSVVAMNAAATGVAANLEVVPGYVAVARKAPGLQ